MSSSEPTTETRPPSRSVSTSNWSGPSLGGLVRLDRLDRLVDDVYHQELVHIVHLLGGVN